MMHATTLGSSVKAMMRLGQAPAGVMRARPSDDDGIILSELQTACDRLTSRLDDASLSRPELIALTVDLEPVGRRLLQMRKSLKKTASRDEVGHSQTHAIRLVDAALHDIYEGLYYTRPWRPYIWPGALQARLWHAQHSLAHALVALRWARIDAGQLA
jgi:hypothetical protein